MKKVWLLLFLFIGANQCFAQLKSGKIEFEISYPSVDLPADQLAMLPSNAVVYFTPQTSRTEMQMGMGVNMVTIHTGASTVMLMDVMGKKIAMKQPEELVEGKVKDKNGKVDVSVTAETKEIAGYTCKKAIVKSANVENMIVWYTDQIASTTNWDNELDQLKGMALEFDLKTDQLTMHMRAEAVKSEAPVAGLFVIPADYREVSAEELKALFGGNE